MKLITKYVCEHCNREYKRIINAIEHEDICWKNKENRTCLTCKYNGDIETCYHEYGSEEFRVCTNEKCEECEEHEGLEPIIDCEFWEVDVRTKRQKKEERFKRIIGDLTP